MIQDDPSVIKPTLEKLKKTFFTHKTKSLSYRKQQLQNLLKGLKELESEFHQALGKDVGASEFYSKAFSTKITEIEVKDTLANFEKWAKIRKQDTSMLVGPGFSYVQPDPLGVALVISAWNYPVYTAIPPAAQAIAAGNCVVLKPSEMAPHSSNVIVKLFQKYLDPDCYAVIEGGVKVAIEITQNPFDLIIFTGSPEKGRLVAQAAAKNLIPCILELGGKSPTIVDSDTNIKNACLRVAQGRFINSGQTCVACDFVLCHESIVKEFTKELKNTIIEFYGKDAQQSPDYIKIINSFHTERIKSMLDEDHGGVVEHGGKSDVQGRYVEPTIVSNPRPDSRMMTEEIFGPILPIIPYKNIQEAIEFINKRPKPLALYYFGYKNLEIVQNLTSSGSFAQNEAAFQILNPDIPFGGVQNSGLGAYHGKYGFDGCSHLKAVFHKKPINIWPYTARYPPYTESRQKVLGTLMDYMGMTQASFAKGTLFVLSIIFAYYFHKGGYFNQIVDAVKPQINEWLNKQSKL